MNRKARLMDLGMPLVDRHQGALMIIFIITFAIVALFALTLTGSIASTSRRRS
jgi:hypothetical protein